VSRDTGVALLLLLLAGLYWLGADQIRVSRLEGIVGAQVVPKGLALSLAILSVLLIAQDLWRVRRAAAAAPGTDREAGGAAPHLRAVGMLLIGMGYLAVVGTIGYLPAIALLVLATARYVGRPWSAELFLVAGSGALLYYLLFVRLLDIPLPPGIWPGLWRALAG
jgi:putative tricarboxylic transport membrane protein